MALDNLREIKRVQKEFDQKISKLGKKAAKELLELFFDKNPDINAIRWSQYTPYYSDGDTCEFGIWDILVSFDATPKDEGVYHEMHDYGEHPLTESGKNKEYIASLKKKVERFREKMEEISKIFQHAFGDHIQVTVFNDGKLTLSIDSYEHE